MSDNEESNISNHIDLTKNGRLFPSWIMMNFKKYELPEVLRAEGEDPCNEIRKKELTKYQEFIGQFLKYKSPYKDLLIYHGLGSGKTVSAINVYNVLFNYTPKWNIFILIPASLKDDPWLKDLNAWIDNKDKKIRMDNIIFVHYDSPYANTDFLEKVRKADSSKTSIYIIDEVHNFIRNVYNNISTQEGQRAQVIYDYIQQEKKENDKTRIMLLSATPAVNTPYEFALIFNLMRPDTFPTSEAIFNQIYISSTNYQSLNENNKNMFQRRIMGLVSYYIGATPDKYATKRTHYKNITMNNYHQEVYEHYEKIEEEKEKIRRRMFRGVIGKDNMSTYSTYTRQSCNFVFPPINKKINGETRPRPSHFRAKDEDTIIIDEGKDIEKKKKLIKNKEVVRKYNEAIKNYIEELKSFFKKIHDLDKTKNHTLKTDVNNFAKLYNGSLTEFLNKSKKKSGLFEILYKCSPKMTHIIFNIIKSPGSVLVYSNYVIMEGLQIFKVYLSFFGFISFENDKEYKSTSKKPLKKDYYRYMEFHGGIDKKTRTKNKTLFNSKENSKGKVMKIIMISPAGAEGINLSNVRQVHIMEPYWNEARIEQVIGRAIRQCQHKDLPMKDRTVEVFRYKMVRKNEKETSDEKLENISRKKNNLLLSFIEAIKEVAIDCELFKSHNMMGNKYKCFKFNEDSLFEEPIGPAYLQNMEYDKKIDNGTNSKDTNLLKVKVRLIKCVNMIDDKNLSESYEVWFNENNDTVYDKELHFPIGKIEKDDNGFPKKIDDETYIISKLIKVPIIKLYN